MAFLRLLKQVKWVLDYDSCREGWKNYIATTLKYHLVLLSMVLCFFPCPIIDKVPKDYLFFTKKYLAEQNWEKSNHNILEVPVFLIHNKCGHYWRLPNKFIKIRLITIIFDFFWVFSDRTRIYTMLLPNLFDSSAFKEASFFPFPRRQFRASQARNQLTCWSPIFN